MSQPWERVAAGRYATEFNGHILQAIRRDGPYDPNTRPYMAVVDRVPLEPGSWSLAEAKTKAIRHVTNKTGKPKERNGHKQAAEENFEAMFTQALALAQELAQDPPPEPVPEPPPPPPEPVPEPVPEPDEHDDLGIFNDLPIPEEPDPSLFAGDLDGASSPLPSPSASLAPEPGRLCITGTITNPDLLAGLNEIRQLLDMMREHAEVECLINMPPILKL